MNRRELLQVSAALSMPAFATLPQADEKPDVAPDVAKHAHHHHGSAYAELAHTATHCILIGEACIDHCQQLPGEGDEKMAACAGECAKVAA